MIIGPCGGRWSWTIKPGETMQSSQAYIEDQIATLRANVRLYEIATSPGMRALAAERLVHAVKEMDALGVFDHPAGFRLNLPAGR